MARDTMPTPLILQQHGSAPKNSHANSDKDSRDPEQPGASPEPAGRAPQTVPPANPQD